MAEGYGSVSRPVVHDPFRRIVDVHWNSETHFALFWTPRGRSTFVDTTEGCDRPEYGGPLSFGYPPPPHPVGFTWLSRVEYYLPPENAQGIADMVVRSAKKWHGLKDTPVITGLPTLPPAAAHGMWSSAWLSVGGTIMTGTDTDGVTRHAENDLAASFAPGSGTNTDIDVPNAPGSFFQTGFTPAFGFRASPFLSAGAVCYTDGFLTSTVRLYSETPDWVDQVPVPVASVEVTYRNNKFRGMAARRIETVHAGTPIARGCWILCEREKP